MLIYRFLYSVVALQKNVPGPLRLRLFDMFIDVTFNYIFDTVTGLKVCFYNYNERKYEAAMVVTLYSHPCPGRSLVS